LPSATGTTHASLTVPDYSDAMMIASSQRFASIAFPLIGSARAASTRKRKAIMLDELAKCDTLVAVKVVIYNP